jgi:hypothetical protein
MSPSNLSPLVEKAGSRIQESEVIGEKSKAVYLKARKE